MTGAYHPEREDLSRALRQRPEREGLSRVVDKPDLSRVDEIGYVDLMPGSGHGPGGWIDVAAIEVYGRPVKR